MPTTRPLRWPSSRRRCAARPHRASARRSRARRRVAQLREHGDAPDPRISCGGDPGGGPRRHRPRAGGDGISESRRWQGALFENALDAIFVIDDAGRYVEANPAAGALLGYSREELLSLKAQDITSFAHPERVRRAGRVFQEQGAYLRRIPTGPQGWSLCEAEFRSVANTSFPAFISPSCATSRSASAWRRNGKRCCVRLVHLQEEERRAIARELHDEVGQLLTGLRLMVENPRSGGGSRRGEIKRVVNELIGRCATSP